MCNKKGKCKDGAYVCAECIYVVHEKCPHFTSELNVLKNHYTQIMDAIF